MRQKKNKKKKFVTPLEIIPHDIDFKNKTKRQVLLELFEASLNECEKNKIDLRKIKYFVFHKEFHAFERHDLEKYFFIYDLD